MKTSVPNVGRPGRTDPIEPKRRAGFDPSAYDVAFARRNFSAFALLMDTLSSPQFVVAMHDSDAVTLLFVKDGIIIYFEIARFS